MEYEDARETVNTAFYTSPVISQAIYTALEQFGFQKGTILEPALGTGHFFGTLPEKFEGSKLFGVEKDSISGRIAKLLYQRRILKYMGLRKHSFLTIFLILPLEMCRLGISVSMITAMQSINSRYMIIF